MCAVEPSSVLVSVGGNWGFRWITWKTSQWENVIIDDVCNRRWVWVDVASVKISAWCIFLWVICKFSAIIAHWVKLLTEIRIFLSQIKVIFCFLFSTSKHWLPAKKSLSTSTFVLVSYCDFKFLSQIHLSSSPGRAIASYTYCNSSGSICYVSSPFSLLSCLSLPVTVHHNLEKSVKWTVHSRKFCLLWYFLSNFSNVKPFLHFYNPSHTSR